MSIPELLPDLPQTATESKEPGDLAVMLTGGGARAAYQVGLLLGLARRFPDLHFDIITGVSAGAINAVFLAAKPGSFTSRVETLAEMWQELQCEHVFRPNYAALLPFRSQIGSVLPKKMRGRPHGFFNAGPLAELLRRVYDTHERNAPIEGIRRNLAEGNLKAVSLMTLDYNSGQNVRWCQGRTIDVFEGPNRRSAETDLTVEHVLASSALPLFFPAVRIGDRWHGDGGIRLAAPLSPAVHLGASRILAMSTGYQRTPDEAETPVIRGYPPAAQIISQLVNAIFLDVIDEDVLRMERLNEMIGKLDDEHRNGFRQIELMVLRPSQDLGKLGAQFQRYLPASMKAFIRTLGVKETDSPDFVSMLLFEPHYTRAIMEIGEHDVDARLDELKAFLGVDVGLRAAELPRN